MAVDGRPARRVRPALGMGLTTLADVADALYAGDPADFVVARDAAARAAPTSASGTTVASATSAPQARSVSTMRAPPRSG